MNLILFIIHNVLSLLKYSVEMLLQILHAILVYLKFCELNLENLFLFDVGRIQVENKT